MGRRKKNAESDSQPSAAGIGHNGLTDDQRHALTADHAKKYEQALATKKASDKAFKDCCKRAHADLGDSAVLDIKDMLAASTPEGEKALVARIQAEEERQKKIARWLGLAPGTEPSMFDEDRTPAVDRAFADGKRHGLDGQSAKPPHDPNTEQYREWMRGHAEGQAVLSKGFKPLSAAAAGDEHIRKVAEKLANDTASADEAALMN